MDRELKKGRYCHLGGSGREKGWVSGVWICVCWYVEVQVNENGVPLGKRITRINKPVSMP